MLTPAQLATLKAHITASGDLNSLPNSSDGNFAVAALLNIAASPAVVVWKTAVTNEEVMLNGFNWTRVDNLSVGKARIWDWMFRFGTIDPSKPNIRAGIDAVWVGTQADLDVRAAVYVHCKRNATRFEALFASGGAGTDANPHTMAIEGIVSADDVQAARNS